VPCQASGRFSKGSELGAQQVSDAVTELAVHKPMLQCRERNLSSQNGPSVSGSGAQSIALGFRWRPLGQVHLDSAGKPVFPSAAAEPGVYRLEVQGEQASVYFGEASDRRRRFSHYRNPGPSQQTNQRLNGMLVGVLAAGGACRVSTVEVLNFGTRLQGVALDLRQKAARVLVESAAIVLARTDGSLPILNLDKAFDRTLGG
jgi:hypothetical protein